MRFTALLALSLAATAAHSHDAVVDRPELPIPEIDQLFPVDNTNAAFRWADRPLRFLGEHHSDFNLVVALTESQFGQVDALLAGIQQPQISIPNVHLCDGLDGRFGVYLQGWSQGGVDDEALFTLGNMMPLRLWASYLLKNRFSVAGGFWDPAVDLRDTGMSMRFRFRLADYVWCAGEHTSHSNGSARHNRQQHPPVWLNGPFTDWIPIADLLDGDVALRAELDALRGDLAAVRDSVAWLSSRSNTGGDTTAVRPSSWGQIKALMQGE